VPCGVAWISGHILASLDDGTDTQQLRQSLIHQAVTTCRVLVAASTVEPSTRFLCQFQGFSPKKRRSRYDQLVAFIKVNQQVLPVILGTKYYL